MRSLPGRRDRQLGLIVAALSLFSLGAFVGQVYDVFDMSFVIAFFALPATVAIIGIAFWARRANQHLFVRRLILGLFIGIVATAAYDLIRLVIQSTPLVDFNAFAVHPRFGEMIIDQPASTTAAKVVGWSYHISNGLTFALCYTLVAGRARWWWGVLYAVALQSLMVLMYPRAFGLSRGNEDFLVVSFIGHAAYGVVLGVLNHRYNQSEVATPSRALR